MDLFELFLIALTKGLFVVGEEPKILVMIPKPPRESDKSFHGYESKKFSTLSEAIDFVNEYVGCQPSIDSERRRT